MAEGLDFSSVGPKKSAPAPKRRRRGAPRRGKPPAALIAIAVVLAVAVVGFLVLGGGGGDDADERVAATARYCELAAQLDMLMPNTDPNVGAVDTSPAAASRPLKEMGPTVAEMEGKAPGTIRSDVAAIVDALERAAEGDPAGLASGEFLAQRQRVADERQASCPVGSGSGDG